MNPFAFSSLTVWVSVCAVAAVVILGTAALAGCSGAPPTDLRASGEGEATLKSVTARILSVNATGVETIVTVVFSGPDLEGDSVYQGFSLLRLDDGALLRARWSSVEGRKITIGFDPVPPERSIDTLMLESVSLAQSAPDGRSRELLTPIGSYSIHVLPSTVTQPPTREVFPSLRVQFGAGDVSISRLIISEGQLSIHGRLSEYTPGANPLFDTPELILPDGTRADFWSLNIGFDDDPGIFVMIFNGVAPQHQTAVLLLTTTAPNGDVVPTKLNLELPKSAE